MKIFIGTVNIASQLGDWKFGFEKNSCKVSIGSFGNHSLIVSGDYDYLISPSFHYRLPGLSSYTLNKKYNKLLNSIYGDYRKWLLKKILREYDVFFFIWRGILDDFSDFDMIKQAGKKLLVQFVGDDVRWEPAARQEFIKRGMLPIEYDSYDYSYNSLYRKLNFLRYAEKYADLIYSRPNQAQIALRPYGVNPYLVIPEEFEENNYQREISRIIHYPSSSAFKGTKYIYQSIEYLKESRLQFAFESTGQGVTYGSNLNKIPYTEMKKNYATCDILIGQLLCPGGGKQERELLASGKIVMSNINRYYESHIPKECPIIDVNPDNLAEKLKEIILDYDKRSALAKLGRPYVEQFHDPVKITARILEELTTGEYKCPTYQPTFFREEFIPESPEHLEVYNKWTEFVKNEDWYRQTVPSGERAGLIF